MNSNQTSVRRDLLQLFGGRDQNNLAGDVIFHPNRPSTFNLNHLTSTYRVTALHVQPPLDRLASQIQPRPLISLMTQRSHRDPYVFIVRRSNYSLALALALARLRPFLVHGFVFVRRLCPTIYRPRSISISANPLSIRRDVDRDPSESPDDYSGNQRTTGVGGINSHGHDENNNSVSDNLRSVPASPCNRICRYNSAFYDGMVCIGCFREAYEIQTWNSMTNMQKSMTLLDAIDRCSDESMGYTFDGAVTLDELNHQCLYWSNLAEES